MIRRECPVDVVERALAPGQLRFVPKPRQVGRRTVWDVYDRARGSFPTHVEGFGPVAEALASWGDARAEADRLAGHFGVPGTTGTDDARGVAS